MGGSTASNPHFEPGDGCDTIPRVSRPWPARAKKALGISLDKGIFEDVHVAVLLGSGLAKHPVHFVSVVAEAVGSLISQCELPDHRVGKLVIDSCLLVCHSEPTYQHDVEAYLSTLVINIHIHSLAPHID